MTFPVPVIVQQKSVLIWGIGVLAYLVAITNRTSLSAVGIDAFHRFQVDAATLSLFAVVQIFVYAGMQIPVGLLLDRVGARPMIVVGMSLMAVGQLVLAFADTAPAAIVARIFLGIGDAAVFPSVMRLIAVWFPLNRAPLMAQLTGIVGGTGQFLSLLPLAALLHATTWTFAFSTLGALSALFAVLCFVLIQSRPSHFDQDVSVDTATGAITVVHSSPDLREGFRDAWAHPGTRLAFWVHFTSPFSGSAFTMLWGFPFLTSGQGLSSATASVLFLVYIFGGMAVSPLYGWLSARHPYRRSTILVIPTVILQILIWLVVISWPGRAPIWLLIVLLVAMCLGGPASTVSFDLARSFNPKRRLSTATGIVNVGGFLASLLTVLLIGVALDLLGGSATAGFQLDMFRLAFLVQIPIWALGLFMIFWERKSTRSLIGLRTRN